ncbi:Core-2/I-branching beta-1,6-N-acetylglucosaminyltransferase family protein [Theobroma cacao]|uniref:Core-2/I-branching beta-1,6-N-acetylglucosaminyltransferase family protein n=1 Tax=Theobroma cacao TaxID=3641 RepID=A0A061F0L4_THECC|nr:Core-2/I-branching beta-1,6-N-acetylglucosaminyltransferase family protein [Theobroma cacao]
MGIRIFMISFVLTSILFSLLYIPTKLSIPITSFNPMATLNIVQKSNRTYPVTFAYLISASKGDTVKLKRAIRALYHPGNQYLIHLDYEAPAREHRAIAEFVSNDPVFSLAGNVYIVGKPNLVTYRGPTMLATTLHAMSMLLRCCKWDWFINLSASDYPLVTQDDLIHAFSDLPKDLNFIQHTSHLGWKLSKRGKPIIIDPGLYSLNKSEIWWVIKQRTLPTAFKLYTGSAWTVISRSFAEYSIVGWDNLPRTLLLYYTNFVSSPEGYFQTLICNSEGYKNTTVNHDLHYITWDMPPKQHPRSLGLKDFRRMVLSSRPFARKFKRNDPVLDKIDRELLKRRKGKFPYGGWCFENGKKQRACSGFQGENYGILKPGAGSRRLKTLLTKLLSARGFSKRQCRL